MRPHEICATTKKNLNITSPDEHELLKEEVRVIQFTLDKTLQEYVQEHEELCTKMINAKYPGIETENKSV